MSEAKLAEWYEQAQARWRHLPATEERDRRVRATFAEIQAEAELVAVSLPELDNAERMALLDESVLDCISRYGHPGDDDGPSQELFDMRVDELFALLCLRAREQKAPANVRSKLMMRRLARRWTR